MTEKHSVLFSLTDNALLVANSGRPFDRKGVISICSMDLSRKDADEEQAPEDEYKCDDGKLPDAIREKNLELYSGHINRLKEDAKHENTVERDYSGRFMFEMLQNADDAAFAARGNAQLIGAKGLGFKSVLEITRAPEIYSGKFHFHFSPEKSRAKLQELPGWKHDGIPVCRLPHAVEPDDEVRALLKQGYATVIRLPLIAEKFDAVKKKLEKFSAETMLFCQHLEVVEIRSGEKSPRRIEKISSGSDHAVELHENEKSRYWRVWRARRAVPDKKQLSVSMCLPVDAKEVACCEEIPPFHVFFPTKEKFAGVRALVHASCEIDSNRKYVAESQTYEDKLCAMLKSMTAEILRELPAGAALRAFGKACAGEDATPVGRLENAIAGAVRETAFVPVIGGGNVKPGDVRLWKYGLGGAIRGDAVCGENLCASEVNDDDECRHILCGLGAYRLEDIEHAKLLRFCRNESGEECLAAWDVAQQLMQDAGDSDGHDCADELCGAPFWPTRSGQVRAIIGDIPLAEQKPNKLPGWLEVDVVLPDFRDRVETKKKAYKKQDENWADALSGKVAPATSDERFDRILLDYCNKHSPQCWQERGWEILTLACEWGKRAADQWNESGKKLVINSKSDAEKRAEIFHLPTRVDGTIRWVPARKCYAGSAWGGLAAFDRYFVNIENRFVVLPPSDWHDDVTADIEQWKRVLAWLGCSWEPKMHQLPHLHSDNSHQSTRPGSEQDFEFEHFHEVLKHVHPSDHSDHAELLQMGREMHDLAKSKPAKYFYGYKQRAQSWALKQLQNTAWVPCKKSLLDSTVFHKPEDVYLPGCGLGEMLPEVDKTALGDECWYKIKPALESLHVNSAISKNPTKLVDYMKQLSEHARKNPADLAWGKKGTQRPVARAARAIFDAWPESETLRKDMPIPCIRRTSKGDEIYFAKIDDVYWADKSYFDRPGVRRKILQDENLHVFFRFLKDGEQFNLPRLSAYLEVSPRFGENLPEKAKKMRAQYEERRLGLAKAVASKLPEAIDVNAYSKITLVLEFKSEVSTEVKFWFDERDGDELSVTAGSDSNMWEGLAMALCEKSKCDKKDAPALKDLLQENTWKGFVARLRDIHDLSEDSLQEVENTAPEESAPAEVGHQNEAGRVSRARDSSPASPAPAGMNNKKYAQDDDHAASPVGDNKGADETFSEFARELIEEEPALFPRTAPATNRAGVGSGSGSGSRPAVQPEGGKNGQEAENLLCKWLRREPYIDHVVNKNDSSPNHPGYDILVKIGGRDFYYECKSFSGDCPSHVELTAPQFEKAQDAGEQYVLCIVYATGSKCAKLFRIPNPAKLNNERRFVDLRYRLDLTSAMSTQSDDIHSA